MLLSADGTGLVPQRAPASPHAVGAAVAASARRWSRSHSPPHRVRRRWRSLANISCKPVLCDADSCMVRAHGARCTSDRQCAGGRGRYLSEGARSASAETRKALTHALPDDMLKALNLMHDWLRILLPHCLSKVGKPPPQGCHSLRLFNWFALSRGCTVQHTFSSLLSSCRSGCGLSLLTSLAPGSLADTPGSLTQVNRVTYGVLSDEEVKDFISSNPNMTMNRRLLAIPFVVRTLSVRGLHTHTPSCRRTCAARHRLQRLYRLLTWLLAELR